MAKVQSLDRFKTSLMVLGGTIAYESALTIQRETKGNVGVFGPSLDQLRDAGHPLSASGFNPGAAGLAKEYQIIKQEGHVAAAYGRDPIINTGLRWTTYVGFDHSGTQDGKSMFNLLSWLLDGTSRMVGRPVIINSFYEAVPKLEAFLRFSGLKLVRTAGRKISPLPVSRGPRGKFPVPRVR